MTGGAAEKRQILLRLSRDPTGDEVTVVVGRHHARTVVGDAHVQVPPRERAGDATEVEGVGRHAVPAILQLGLRRPRIATADGLKKIKVAQWGPLDDPAKPLMLLLERVGGIVTMAAAGLEGLPD